MTAKPLTISLPEHLLEFLRENESLSASKVMQGALINIQDSIKHNPQLIEANKTIIQLEKQSERYRVLVSKYADFLDSKKLWEEFNSGFLEQDKEQ